MKSPELKVFIQKYALKKLFEKIDADGDGYINEADYRNFILLRPYEVEEIDSCTSELEPTAAPPEDTLSQPTQKQPPAQSNIATYHLLPGNSLLNSQDPSIDICPKAVHEFLIITQIYRGVLHTKIPVYKHYNLLLTKSLF